jgi:hypothetical protein
MINVPKEAVVVFVFVGVPSTTNSFVSPIVDGINERVNTSNDT